jgi:hypothetical protein
VRVREIYLLGAVLAAGLVACSDKTNPRVVTRLNEEAALVGELPSNPLKGKVITSWVNKHDATVSTMLGNDVAVKYARTNAEMQYPAGSVLSVVTWRQQEDPRWFGGSIPQRARTVEFVTVTGPGAYSYERYEGSPLKQVASGDGAEPKERAAYLLAQRAAVMP